MNRHQIAASLTAAAVAVAVMPVTAEASTSFELRKKVIGLSGIASIVNTEATVTRAEFASMLVNATPYKSAVSQTSATSVFADVPKTSEYAAKIRIAVDQGWMNGYLGGNFRPDDPITLQDAIRGVLALLGYTNDSFSGDQAGGRLNKYYYLELNEEITKEPSEILTKTDCINLFYNLLRTDTTNGSPYCKSLGYDVTSDGEVNPLTIADNALKGPKVVTRSHSVWDYVPFTAGEANIFLNGSPSSNSELKSVQQSYGYVVIYYNAQSKTIWAYSEDGDSAANRSVVRGEITSIYYSSADVLTPSAVELDSSGIQYALNTSDLQFAFSIYGTLKVGETVALICQVTQDSNGTETYTVLDYIED